MKAYDRCRPATCSWKKCKDRKRNAKCPEATGYSRPYSIPYFIVLRDRRIALNEKRKEE